MPADLSMQTADGIDAPAAPDGQVGHVEALRRVVGVAAAQGQHVVDRNAKLFRGVPSQVLFDEGRSEPVKAGGDRRVGGEKVPRARRGQSDGEWLGGLFHEIAGAFQHRQRRVPLVEVTHFRVDAKGVQQAPAADAEENFLLQAQLRPAAVQFAGKSAVHGEIRRVVAIEQVKLHPADLHLPGAQPDRVTGQVDLQPQPFAVRVAQRRDRQLSGVVVRVEGLLRSILVNHLAKIALLVEQPQPNHRDAQVAGRFKLVAGHVAKPSRVNGQRFAQHKFQAEIRHAGQRRLRVAFLEPAGSLRGLPLGFQQAGNALAEGRIGQHPLEMVSRDGL